MTRTRTAMRSAIPLLPLLLLAAACSPAETVVATERVADAAGGVAGETWVLRRIGDAPPPARIQESAEGYAELLADTLRFDDDTMRESGATRLVTYRAVPAVDTVHTNELARPYRILDGQVRIGDPPCGEPRELILCALPDTGRVRGDTLAIATAYPGAVRRASVRIGLP